MSAFLCFPLSAFKKKKKVNVDSKILYSGTLGSLTKANVKSCSSNPTTSRTNGQIGENRVERNEVVGCSSEMHNSYFCPVTHPAHLTESPEEH